VLRQLRTAEAELLARLSQVRKALSVRGEPEADAAVKCPERRAGLSREYLRDPALPYVCLISPANVPWYALDCPATGFFFVTKSPEVRAILLFCRLFSTRRMAMSVTCASLVFPHSIGRISEYNDFLPYLLT
jgi:hypothetical protein